MKCEVCEQAKGEDKARIPREAEAEAKERRRRRRKRRGRERERKEEKREGGKEDQPRAGSMGGSKAKEGRKDSFFFFKALFF